MKNKYEYQVYDGDLFDIHSVFSEEDGEYIAQEAAEDYHSCHDGWESIWPLVITIYSEGRVVGKYDVERDVEPVFYATEVKK